MLTLNIISQKCYDFHALFLYDEILGSKWRKKDKEKAVR